MPRIKDIAQAFTQTFLLGSSSAGSRQLKFNGPGVLSVSGTPNQQTITLPPQSGEIKTNLTGFYDPYAVSFTHFARASTYRGFTTNLNGTGAAISSLAGTETRPGICQCATGTTATGRAGVASNANSNKLGYGRCILKTSVRIPTLSNSTQRFEVLVGFADVSTIIPDNGIHFWYTDPTNSGKWQARTASVSSPTTADTGVSVAANTWYDLVIDINSASNSVDFYVNGTLTNTINTTIPTLSTLRAGAYIRKTVGTTSLNLNLDYMFLALNV